MLAHVFWWCTYCGVLSKSTAGCCSLARASGRIDCLTVPQSPFSDHFRLTSFTCRWFRK
jgi:hypothetical protein